MWGIKFSWLGGVCNPARDVLLPRHPNRNVNVLLKRQLSENVQKQVANLFPHKTPKQKRQEAGCKPAPAKPRNLFPHKKHSNRNVRKQVANLLPQPRNLFPHKIYSEAIYSSGVRPKFLRPNATKKEIPSDLRFSTVTDPPNKWIMFCAV